MSQQPQKLGFNYIDDTDESLKSKAGGKFGLNTPAFLTKFELNANAGTDGAAQDALDITIQIVDKEYRERIYPIDNVYDSAGNEIEDKTSAEYVKAYNTAWSQKNAVIIHLLKCFRTDDEVRQALSQPAASFADYINMAAALLPEGFDKIALDIFLEYQWNISEGQDRTFLQLPRNMKGGAFACPSVAHAGDWIEQKTDNGIRYVDANNVEHPFTRDANYAKSNKANQQVEGEEASNEALGAAAKEGTW